MYKKKTKSTKAIAKKMQGATPVALPEPLLTTREVARLLNLSEESVRNYSDDLKPIRTPGGHRRYKVSVVNNFIEKIKS